VLLLIKSGVLNSRLASRASLFAPDDAPPVEWVVTPGLTPYAEALADMETRADAIARGGAPERVWLLEHPPLYTAGTSAKESDLVEARFPVHRAGRGGQFTYHGPGQRVAYVMLDLKRRRPDVRAYVASLEHWLIEALKAFDVVADTRERRVGVWVARPDKPPSPLGEMAEDKICTASRSTSIPTSPTFPASSRAASPKRTMASPVSPTSAGPRPWRKRTPRCGRRSKPCLALPDPASAGLASGCPTDRPKL
jgi:lipoyl(octanoyl) transferase